MDEEDTTYNCLVTNGLRSRFEQTFAAQSVWHLRRGRNSTMKVAEINQERAIFEDSKKSLINKIRSSLPIGLCDQNGVSPARFKASKAGDHTGSPQRKLWVKIEEKAEPAKRAT